MLSKKTLLLYSILLVSIIIYNFETIFPAPPPYELSPEYKNICINKKDPTQLTKLEYLKEFIKGPCSPFAIVPGFFGSRLVLQLNCTELQSNYPEIFQSCYWNSCDRDLWPFYRKPKAEYDVWIPELFGPLGFLVPNYFTDDCFYNLVKQVYNTTTSNPENFVQERKGINITWHGNTNETFYKSKCGYDALGDLRGWKGRFPQINALKPFLDSFEYMGYLPGLTIQAIPYDFRICASINKDFAKRFKPVVKNLHKITGKKVIILAHSYGNVMFYFNIKNGSFTQKEKDMYIKNVISSHACFLGTINGTKWILGGEDVLNFGPFGLGFKSFWPFGPLATIHLGSVPYSFGNVFENDRNENWMKNITQHIQYEKDVGHRKTEKGIDF